MTLMRSKLLSVVFLASFAMLNTAHASPYDYSADARDEPRNAALIEGTPSEMKDLQEIQKVDPVTGEKKKSGSSDALENSVDQEKDLALKIRRDSQKEAALSFGARGGLAFRTKLIMDQLKQNEAALDRVYNFRRLLIKAPSNMFIEPPIISEALNNLLVSPEGDSAAVSDAVYEISRKARIVSAPRNWRQYLERTWSTISPPPDILLPETADERKAWRIWISKGWHEGYDQADEIFQADLDRLSADFQGQVRYRILLAQNKISQPYATLVDRGVTGVETETNVGGHSMKITNEMRIGDRAIQITQPVTLRPNNSPQIWEPPVETSP